MAPKPTYEPIEDEYRGASPRDTRLLNITAIINVLMLSIAGVAVTWCSYQAARWSGIQAFSMAGTNASYRQAQEEHEVAMQKVLMDEMLVVNFVNAVMANDSMKMNFYTEHVRPELSTILKSWLRQDPFHNKNGPPHPGEMDEYKQILTRKFAEMDAFKAKGNAYWQEAQHANRTADNYVLITVIFSVVMFLCGVAPKVHVPRLTFGLSLASAIIGISLLVFLLIKMPIAQK